MKDWESEEEIKAQLRELTERTRKLRGDLQCMLTPQPQSRSRAFMHRQAWPKNDPPAVVNDRRRRKKR